MSAQYVYIVDDEEVFVRSVEAVFQSVDLSVKVYQHPVEFLELATLERPCCVVLDSRMPSISGSDVLQELKRRHHSIPVVMVSAHADVAMAVQAMQRGAADFFEKPIPASVLLPVVQRLIQQDTLAVAGEQACRVIREKLQMLTDRERHVLSCLVEGQPNKLIARAMDISVKAVEGHRQRLLRKMECGSAIELVRKVSVCPKAGSSPLSCPFDRVAL